MPLDLNLYYYPSPILKDVCSVVTDEQFKEKEQLDELTSKMVDLMFRLNGQGLSAPQVGISKRIFIFQPMNKTQEPIICFNPEIEQTTGKEINTTEGCLSIPWVTANISGIRNNEIHVRFYNSSNEEIKMMLQGEDAFAFSHEFDHLNGVVIWDHVGSAQKQLKRKKYLKNLKRFANYIEYSEGHYFTHPDKWKEFAK